MIKNWGTCVKKYKDFECFLEYANLKDNLIEYKCLCFNKSYIKKAWRKLKQQLNNFLIHTTFLIMISISLLSCCEYMEKWEILNKTLLEKENFYSHLNL